MLSHHTPRIPLVPRTVANCLDLAVRYCGRDLPQMLCLWLTLAVPTCAVVYFLGAAVGLDARMAVLAVWLAGPLLGLLVVSDVVGVLFSGVPPVERPHADVVSRLAGIALPVVLLLAVVHFDRALGLRVPRDARVLISGLVLGAVTVLVPSVLLLDQRPRLRTSAIGALPLTMILQGLLSIGPVLILYGGSGAWVFLGLMIALIAGTWLSVQYAFRAERAALRRLDPALHEPHVDAVLSREYGELVVRGGTILAFCLLIFVVLLLSLDMAAGLMLGRITLFERVATPEQAWRYLTLDPFVLTAATAVALLVYPVGRLAWFFCYIDLRVRRDGWDLELLLAQEAAHLRPME